MKIYIHYKQKPSPGYTPRETLRLYNVDKILDNGVNSVQTRTFSSDNFITHDHVDRVVVEPEREEV